MPGQRRSYPKSFKAQVVEECTQPGASVAGVALSHGLNANLVHKWIIPHRAGKLSVQWPGKDPEGCARFLRELLK
ncbi:hypothetical protein AO906_14350 [Pseudomonas aeruginosa]|uniref:transposase n=1 Tax=Pseudomonas aeruginosa TaxID=287 RepID=UPI00071B180D|nr:transposase [Pseudomonas aeruginosa]KSD92075.1 hypothetical protein AO906_14350 [Pseudomonas aeruginosa]